ncbi:MAG: MmcQ/YjbR family DNA-binding protein [Anaerolineales bacterium]
MNLPTLRTYCLAKPGTTEERPFGPDTLVYKVMGKMFALTGDELEPQSVNLKCDPDDALFFRHHFEGIQAGYHMDKRHWITVDLTGSVPESLIFELIDDSYELVIKGLRKKEREVLAKLTQHHAPS